MGQRSVSEHRTFYCHGKLQRFPLHRRLSGPQNRSRGCEEQINPFLLRGTGPKLSRLHNVLERFVTEGDLSGVICSKQTGRVHKSLIGKPEIDSSGELGGRTKLPR